MQHLSMNNKAESDGNNLPYIRQLRLQGQGTITAITNLITNNQQQEKVHLRKPLIFYSLYGKHGHYIHSHLPRSG
jgi:hypothetical protein